MSQPTMETNNEWNPDPVNELAAALIADGEIEDLRLSVTQETDIKAGTLTHKPPCPCSICKGYMPNHNETVAEDETHISEAFADLPVAEDASIKAGAGSSGTGKTLSAALLGKDDSRP